MPQRKGVRRTVALIPVQAGKGKVALMPVQAGGSAFTDFFTKTIPNAAKTVYNKAIKPAYNFAKDTKIVSRLADAAGQKGIAEGARQVGLGHRRKRKTQKGGAKAVGGGAMRY